MFCSECGKQLPEGALFCQECGTKVDGETNRLYQSEMNENSHQEETRKLHTSEKETKQFDQCKEVYQKILDNLKKLPYQSILDKLKKIPMVWKIGALAGVLLFIVCIGLLFRKQGQVVRESYLDQYSDSITVGDAFDSFFDDEEWSDYKEDGDTYVVFTGKCFYLEEKVDVKVSFKIKDDYFYVTYMEMNGEPQSEAMLDTLLNKIYEKSYW